MMRRGKSSQQEDSVCRPFGVSVPSGSARYPMTLRKSREDRREAYSNAPRAPENQRGGGASWPQRRRPRRRPQRRARRNNLTVVSLILEKNRGAGVQRPYFIVALKRDRYILALTRDLYRPDGARPRPSGFSKPVRLPENTEVGATFPDAPAAKTSTAAPLVTQN
jgi:hypothetical protein